MNKQMKMLVGIGTLLFIPGAVTLYMEWTNTGILQGNFLLRFVVLVSGCAVIASIGALILYRLDRPEELYRATAQNIADISARFRIPNDPEGHHSLFFLSDANNRIHTEESKYGSKDTKKHNTIYYALSAKEYLNWVDYVYFNYIRRLKDKLKCKVIICLHVPDDIKGCKVTDPDADPNRQELEYQRLCEKFKVYIERVIGNDVEIVTEEYFYKQRAKKFADFHLVYNAFILYFASLLTSDNESERINFEQFKRRLSHVNSAFPIWMIATRSDRERIFVLDNALSLQIWQLEPLASIRTKHDIYFIEANDIEYANGERINVHREGNTINLTDSPDVLQTKIVGMDNETKKIVVSLLDEGMLNANNYYALTDAKINDNLYEVLQSIRSKYSF